MHIMSLSRSKIRYIWGFHTGFLGDSIILGHDIQSLCLRFPIFLRNALPSRPEGPKHSIPSKNRDTLAMWHGIINHKTLFLTTTFHSHPSKIYFNHWLNVSLNVRGGVRYKKHVTVFLTLILQVRASSYNSNKSTN